MLAPMLFVLVPVCVAFLAGLLAMQREPGPKTRGAILHLAAGVVVAVVAVELIPDLLREHSPAWTASGFAAGVVTMLVVRALLEREGHGGAEAPDSGKLPLSMLLAIVIDLFIDGLLIGVGFAAGARQGRLLALALGTELVALSLATSATLRRQGVAKGRVAAILGGLLGVFLVAALIGTVFLTGLTGHALVVVLSFGAAALLFLVTEELLIEAHEERETAWMTATFFAGFLVILLVGMRV
jgi:ZIP family zinc transporter